jgi:hypothetical protein
VGLKKFTQNFEFVWGVRGEGKKGLKGKVRGKGLKGKELHKQKTNF